MMATNVLRFLATRPAALCVVLLVAACARSAGSSETASDWYHRARQIDLTGTNPQDSVVLTAQGTRADSLDIVLTFYVGGDTAHVEKWDSSYEMIDLAVSDTASGGVGAYIRRRMDSVIAGVTRLAVTAEDSVSLTMMGDSAVLAGLPAWPKHVVRFSYGYESGVDMVWSPQQRRLIVVMECC